MTPKLISHLSKNLFPVIPNEVRDPGIPAPPTPFQGILFEPRVVLCRPSGKWQQGNIARLLDRQRQTPLVRRAHACQAPGHDPPAFRHELRQQTDVLVVDGLDLFDAELANLLAPEILPSTRAALATAARPARTRRTPLAAIRPVTAGR